MRRLLFFVPVALAAAVSGCGGLFDPFKSNDARTSASNLLEIGFALHAYNDAHGHLPIHGTGPNGGPVAVQPPPKLAQPKKGEPLGFPPAGQTEVAKPLLSWRVAILPYIEQEALYRKFKHDEPWDSEHNKKLIPLMPRQYAPVAKAAPEGHTYWQQLIGPGGMRLHSSIPGSIPDGTSNTAAVVEAADAVPWTKPADVEVPKAFAPGELRAKFAGQFKGGFFVLLWDGSVSVARDGADETALKHLFCPNDGEVVNHDLWRLFAADGARQR
jgi:hypothetical protein